LERDRIAWPLLKNVTWYIGHYLDILAPARLTLAQIFEPSNPRVAPNLNYLTPDRFPLILLCLGCVAILAARDRKMLPYLIGAGLFFFSKPLNTIAAPHHLILWLPFFFMVCAYPVGKLCQLLSDRLPHGRVWAAVALVGMLSFSVTQLPAGPRLVPAQAQTNEARLHNIEKATGWIKTNAEPKATVAIAFYCFNPDVFYAWLTYLRVPLPPEAFDGRDYLIWWGQGSALRGKTGYACVTRSDVRFIKTRIDLASPGEGTDPYTDSRFKPAGSFGSGPDEVDLFRFDYR